MKQNPPAGEQGGARRPGAGAAPLSNVVSLYAAADRAFDREFVQTVDLLISSLASALRRWRENATGSISSSALLTTIEAIERCLVLAVPGPIVGGDYRPTPREFAELIYALVSFGTEIVQLSMAAGAALERFKGANR